MKYDAFSYAKLGWPVFPCHSIKNGECSCGKPDCSPGKHPRTDHGFNDATTDISQIKQWWELWPDANIAVCTGAKSGIAVLDVDSKNGGLGNLELLESEHGALPETLVAQTGGGGRHYFFSYPENGFKNSAGKIASGIDTRGEGGYVIVEPSNHISGDSYHWLDSEPGKIKLTPPPEWILRCLAESTKVANASNGNNNGTGKIQQGGRNCFLTSMAGKMRHSGMEKVNILPALSGINQAGCNPPLPSNEVEAIAQSIGNYSKGQKAPILSLNSCVLDFEELLKADLPDRKMILPWLPEGGLVLIAAKRGLGKTFFGISLGLSAAKGLPFMKWAIQKSVGVLYVDGEMPLSDYRERVSNFTDEIPEGSLITLNHQMFYEQWDRDLDITCPDVQNSMIRLMDSHPEVRLVILDNLSSLAKIPEDKSDDWREKFLPFLIKCRRREVAVVLIHHTNKAGDQRGTGAREDHLDTSILLKPVGGEDNDGAYFKVEFTKSRGVYGKEIEPFNAKLSQNANGFLEWTIEEANLKVKERLLKLIENSGSDGITVKDAAEELDVTPSAISKAKAMLIKEGKIRPGKNMKLA
jgi:hypothetical protein